MHVLVVSDHGFGPLKKIFLVNQWLKQKRLLHLKNERYSLSLKYIPLHRFFSKLRLNFLRPKIPFSLLNSKLPFLKRELKPWSSIIDWHKTAAYYAPCGLSINAKGREPLCIVSFGKEYEEIIEKIKRELYELRDPWTGQKIIEQVFRKEEIYHGPYMDKAPDLLFIFKNKEYSCVSKIDSKNKIFTINKNKLRTGQHFCCFNGIFILNSSAVMPGSKPNNAHIMDITPTALHLMGLPIPEQIDGRVLLEVIKPEYQERNPLRKIKYDLNKETMETKLDEQEQEKIKEELRGLGYLG